MKIDSNRPSSLNSIRSGAKLKSGNMSNFNAHVDSAHASETTYGASGLQNTGSIDSLMMLQEVSDATSGSKRAKMRGNKLLDHLEEIKVGLLMGSFSKQNLHGLKQLMLSEKEEISDPDLKHIMTEIEVRVLVELAKLEAAL